MFFHLILFSFLGKEEGGTPKVEKAEKKKEGSAKKENKKDAKMDPEPEPEDMISSVKSRRLMSIQAKKEKEEHDRQNKGQ